MYSKFDYLRSPKTQSGDITSAGRAVDYTLKATESKSDESEPHFDSRRFEVRQKIRDGNFYSVCWRRSEKRTRRSGDPPLTNNATNTYLPTIVIPVVPNHEGEQQRAEKSITSSIAAAVSGFLGLAGKIATTLKNYVDGVQSAPDEVQSLHLEVAALCQVLKDLMVFLQKDDLCGRKFESSSVLFKAIKACQYRLEELRGKLADLSEACLNKKLPGWIKRIKWPLKKDEVQQTMVALRSFAQIFQFSIVANNCELVSKTSSAMILQLDENRQGIEKLAAGLEAHSVSVPSKLKQQMSELSEIKTLVTELSQFNMEVVHNIPLGMSEIQERLQGGSRDICDKPHRRHQDIWQKRLEGTGNWFLLETEFQKWRDNESDDGSICSILACSGIPGAGKSVVCSIVFSHLETKFASEELVCVACLYCDYQEEKKQTPANMIGVLLNQVIATLNKARLLPSDIISTLKERLNEQKSLNLGEACRLLGKTVKHLRRFYVCIDALDECNERHRRDFIQSLAKVSSECRQPTVIRIFFTSRPHIKWKELMNRYSRLGPLDHICLKAQPEDIRIYISHEIDIDENGDCMNEKLRSEILDTIVANSDGM
ncbi:hypothetical protein BZA77DRAFT_293757 [Pyronema omphalodes]|nr:hypothetical protein BZA77DRAFT_293757 [Pyronema omphalodes]